MIEGGRTPSVPRSDKLRPELRPLAVSYFVTYLGDGLFYVCAALYFTRVIGLEPVTYGAVLTAAWLGAMLVGVPVGHLADRFESRLVSVVMMCLSGLAIAVFVLASSLPVFVLAAGVLAVCTQGTHSARSALVGRTFPADQVTRVRAILVATANAGLALGAALGAAVIAVDTATTYRIAFGFDAVTFVIAAVILLAIPATGRVLPATASDVRESSVKRESPLAVFRDRGYVAVGAANMLLTLHVPLIDVTLPLWIVQHTAAPEWIIAAVFVVNTALVVLWQYRVSKKITSIDDGLRSLRVAGLLLFAAMILYGFSSTPSSPWVAAAVLLAAVTVLTFGDVRQTASMTEISFRLVPGGRYGQYQGFFGMGSTMGEAIGPLLLTWLVLGSGTWGWLLLGAVFLFASLAMRFGVDLARRAPIPRVNLT
jgi:MFS family permease